MSTVHVVPCSTDSCSDTLNGVVQTANKEKKSQVVASRRLKNVIKTIGLRVEKVWCLDRWSLMRGQVVRLQVVVNHHWRFSCSNVLVQW